MDRMPCLELALAFTASGVGVVIGAISERIGLVPLTWEPVVFGAFGGLLAGWLMRRHGRRHPGAAPTDAAPRLCDELIDDEEIGDSEHASARQLATELAEERWPLVRIWLGSGAAAGALISLVIPFSRPAFIPPTFIEGMALGAVAAAMLFPACAWLMGQARVAQRARLGSIVAAADRRAIWSTSAVVLSLSSMAGLLLAPSRATMLVAAAGGMLALSLWILDRHACDSVGALTGVGEKLDAFQVQHGEHLVAKTDLGLGDQILGELQVGATYRDGGRRVPLLRGSVEKAREALERCCSASGHRLLIAFSIWIAHGIALSP
jgi:MFS family permease